jgi:addiction module HigA family antidote
MSANISSIGRPVQTINEIIRLTKQITPETAIELSQALGTSAEFWTNLESKYRLHLKAKQIIYPLQFSMKDLTDC